MFTVCLGSSFGSHCLLDYRVFRWRRPGPRTHLIRFTSIGPDIGLYMYILALALCLPCIHMTPSEVSESLTIMTLSDGMVGSVMTML